MPSDPTPGSHSLDDLAAATGIPERTIRSYIGRGLLPPPYGRGRSASYGDEHLSRLQFLVRVRAAVTFELPLDVLKRLLNDLPPEQIARIARGEEAVNAVPLLGDFDTALLRRKRGESEASAVPEQGSDSVLMERKARYGSGGVLHSLASGSTPSPRPASKPPVDQDALPETWTTMHITPDLRLSMRGKAPGTAHRLKQIADRLRLWLDKEDSP